MERVFYSIIFLVCSGLALWFTSIQFKRYVKNEDFSLVSYHQLNFSMESKDQPPTYTLCIFKENGILKNSNELSKGPTNDALDNYHDFLNGTLENNLKSQEQIFSKISFDDVAIDLIYNMMISLRSVSQTGQFYAKNCRSGVFDCIRRNLPKSHQNPHEICYTRKFSFGENFAMASDLIWLNVRNMVAMNISLNVYVHQRNQMIAHMSASNKPQVKTLTYSAMRSIYHQWRSNTTYVEIKLDVSNIVVFRKRNKDKSPCNEGVSNADEEWRNFVLKNTGCTPSYWKVFQSNVSSPQNREVCKSHEYGSLVDTRAFKVDSQLGESFKNFSVEYGNNCIEMRREVSNTITQQINYADDECDACLGIMISYKDNKYMEIKNVKAYNSETLLSQVGGFIGMYI